MTYRYIVTMTTHRAAPEVRCTAPDAYKMPMSNRQPEIKQPPRMVCILLDQLSALRVAGMVTATITMAVTPEAMKEDFCEVMPAC